MGKNVVALMLQEYENFTKSEKKIVDYVLEHQKETQYISITDLSAACDVAVSTISVFCRKLKLAGFNDFKLELAKAALIAGNRAPSSVANEEILLDDSVCIYYCYPVMNFVTKSTVSGITSTPADFYWVSEATDIQAG